MDHEQIRNPNWWQRSWKWLLGASIAIILISLVVSSRAGSSANDLAQAYTDQKLFDDALEMAGNKKAVIDELGQLKPLDPLAIFEGQIEYTNNRYRIRSTVRVTGTKGRALMDIRADRVNGGWDYESIGIRIKSNSNSEQSILVLSKNP